MRYYGLVLNNFQKGKLWGKKVQKWYHQKTQVQKQKKPSKLNSKYYAELLILPPLLGYQCIPIVK